VFFENLSVNHLIISIIAKFQRFMKDKEVFDVCFTNESFQ